MNFIHEHFSHRRESAFNWKLETGNLLRSRDSRFITKRGTVIPFKTKQSSAPINERLWRQPWGVRCCHQIPRRQVENLTWILWLREKKVQFLALLTCYYSVCYVSIMQDFRIARKTFEWKAWYSAWNVVSLYYERSGNRVRFNEKYMIGTNRGSIYQSHASSTTREIR